MHIDLTSYGWDTATAISFEPLAAQGYLPGRVLAEHRQHYLVVTSEGEGTAVVSGRMRYQASVPADYPTVGDWVVLGPRQRSTDRFKIHAVLPRSTRISRKSTGEHASEQIMGANIDTLLIMTSLNQELNLRRLERYLVLARNSGAQPVLLLNKADLCPEPEAALEALKDIAQDIPVLILSALTNLGLEQLQPYLYEGQILAMIGSSGVGKSTLLNALLGQEVQRVQQIRVQDARGRHTTVHRQLFLLPEKRGLILDVPGLREIQLWEGGEGLDAAFSDIQTLISHCRFPDCRHDKEPNCAVREALNTGLLDKKRWRNYLKLSNETLYLEQRKAEQRAIENRIRAKNKYKQARRAALYGYLSKR